MAIARALVNKPKVLLLDEPLAALDFKRKSEIMPWLEKLKTNLKIPMLYVTHSAEEVLHLADNLIVMEDGELDLGEFGRIHFIDWDQTRARKRTVQVMLIGE